MPRPWNRYHPYTEKLFVPINGKTMPVLYFASKSAEIRVKSSIVRIIIPKSDIAMPVFDKKIQKISILTIKYHDLFSQKIHHRK